MSENICTVRQTCRICGSSNLEPVIHLGDQYIASIFSKGDVPDFLKRTYPLELVRCSSNNSCGLTQLRHTIAPEVLYANYGYRSGTNEIMRTNLRDIVSKIEKIVELKSGDIVLDIGCNDCTLLDSYQNKTLDKIGFDPASNIVESICRTDIKIENDFFSFKSFNRLRPGCKVKVVTSIAMFYDLEDPFKLVSDVAKLLADEGVWVIELSYLPFMIERNLFDTICHEHLEYYMLKQIEWMMKRANLSVHDVEFNDVNGGSIRIFIRSNAFGPIDTDAMVKLEKIRRNEVEMGYTTDGPYSAFRNGTKKVKKELVELLKEINNSGKSVYIYGASTKGNTLLQYCGIDNKMVKAAADRNPDKWGLKTLGTDIPIISEEEARSQNPDYFLVLPWHFFENFVKREKDFLNRGGKFILPLPEVKVVGKEDV